MKKDRTFGIEIEINNTDPNSSESYSTGLISAYHESLKDVFEGWDAKGDGSLRGNFQVELVSPPLLGMDGVHELKWALDKINKKFNPDITERCGIHVHVGVHDYRWQDAKRLWTIMSWMEPYIYAMLPPSRRESQYCHPLQTSPHNVFCSPALWAKWSGNSVASQYAQPGWQHSGHARYAGFNMSDIAKRGCVEFRYMVGSTDEELLVNWCEFLVNLCDKATGKDDFPLPKRGFSGCGCNETNIRSAMWFMDEFLSVPVELKKYFNDMVSLHMERTYEPNKPKQFLQEVKPRMELFKTTWKQIRDEWPKSSHGILFLPNVTVQGVATNNILIGKFGIIDRIDPSSWGDDDAGDETKPEDSISLVDVLKRDKYNIAGSNQNFFNGR